jgi:hypothetical protein
MYCRRHITSREHRLIPSFCFVFPCLMFIIFYRMLLLSFPFIQFSAGSPKFFLPRRPRNLPSGQTCHTYVSTRTGYSPDLPPLLTNSLNNELNSFTANWYWPTFCFHTQALPLKPENMNTPTKTASDLYFEISRVHRTSFCNSIHNKSHVPVTSNAYRGRRISNLTKFEYLLGVETAFLVFRTLQDGWLSSGLGHEASPWWWRQYRPLKRW